MPRKKKTEYETAPSPTPAERLRYFEGCKDRIVQTIRELVEIESPSDNKHAVDGIAALVAAKFEAIGGRTTFYRDQDFGDSLQINFAASGGTAKRPPVLLLGHYDTVYPLGTLANMPCKIDKGHLFGPGVLDMKSGIALMLHAIEALQTWYGAMPRPVTAFLVFRRRDWEPFFAKDYGGFGEKIGGSIGAGTGGGASRRGQNGTQRGG